MNVKVKKFVVDMEVKNTGIELQVNDTDGAQLGDLIVTKTKLIWCKGKTSRKKGKEITWNKFAEFMKSQ